MHMHTQVRTPAASPAPQQQQKATPTSPRSSCLLLDRFNVQEDNEEEPECVESFPPPLSPSPSDSDSGVLLSSGRHPLNHQAAGRSPNEVNPTAGPRLRPASSLRTLPASNTKKGAPNRTPASSSLLSASEVAFQSYCRLVQRDQRQSRLKQQQQQQQQRSSSFRLPFSGLLFQRTPPSQPQPLSEPYQTSNISASMSRTPGAPAAVEDSPKGAAALFVKLCPSLSFLGLQDGAKSMLGR